MGAKQSKKVLNQKPLFNQQPLSNQQPLLNQLPNQLSKQLPNQKPVPMVENINEKLDNSAIVSRLNSAQINTKTYPVPYKPPQVSVGTLEIAEIEALLDSDPRLRYFAKASNAK
jgi:hypothetical protein